MHKATVFAKAASVVTLAVGGFVPAFSADYYWTGGGDGINWSDAANWSDAEGAPVEKAPHDVAGAAAKFRDGTKAQVCFDVPATSASLDVSANDLDLTFTSTPGVTVRCSLTAGGTAHLRDPARSTIVFDGIRNVWWGNVYLRPAVVWRVKGASGMTLSDVSLARVFPTEESTFIVEGESELNVTGKITVNQRSAVVISNATVAAANLEIPRFSETGGGCVRFEGSHPRLTVSGTVSNNNMNGGGDLEFRVPEGGYDGVPFVHEGTSPFMQSADCPERDRISVLLDSPAVQSGGTLDQVLVSTTAGLAEGRLAYLPARSCCQSISASEDGRSVVFRQRPAASSLRITGEPRPYGMSEPLTLIGLANGESRPLTAPASPSANLVCTGYRLFDIAEDGARTEVDGSPFSGTACAYVHGASRRELVWTWEKPTLYVSPEGDDGATGSDWSSALRTVAEAVSRLDCARVVVSNGTYQISSANPIVVAGGTELVGFGERPEDVVIERTGGATNVLTVA